MNDQYRRLAVFVDQPGDQKFIWVVLENTGDPAVWLDLETAPDAYESWIEAFEPATRRCSLTWMTKTSDQSRNRRPVRKIPTMTERRRAVGATWLRPLVEIRRGQGAAALP